MKWFTVIGIVGALVGALAASRSEAAAPFRATVERETASAYFYGTLPPEVGAYGNYPVTLSVYVDIARDSGGFLSQATFFDYFEISDPNSGAILVACRAEVPITEDQFSLNDDLSGAALDAMIDVFSPSGGGLYDAQACPTIPPTHVVLNWVPEENAQVQTTRSTTRGGPCHIRDVHNMQFATASGTTTAGAAGDIAISGGTGFMERGEQDIRCRF